MASVPYTRKNGELLIEALRFTLSTQRALNNDVFQSYIVGLIHSTAYKIIGLES